MTYYINADTGDDSTGDGSSSNPWLTLAYAYDNSTTGDTIYCQNATATYSFVSDTVSARTIQGESATGVVFDAGASKQGWAIGNGTFTLDNLTIQNYLGDVSKGTMFPVNTADGSTITFSRLIFKDIILGGQTNENRGGLIGSASYGSATATITIKGCLFDDVQRLGTSSLVALVLGAGGTTTVNFFNNTVYKETSGDTVAVIIYCSVSLGDWSYNTKNNIFYNGTTGTLTFRNETYGATTGTKILDHNDFYGDWGAKDSGETNGLTSDPLFLDAINGDFRLRLSSPCIDAGTLI